MVAPVKIDPPHSFPTFSPREVCAREDEARWRRRRRHGVAAQGVVLVGVTYHCISVSVYPRISGSSRVFLALRARVHVHSRVKGR